MSEKQIHDWGLTALAAIGLFGGAVALVALADPPPPVSYRQITVTVPEADAPLPVTGEVVATFATPQKVRLDSTGGNPIGSGVSPIQGNAHALLVNASIQGLSVTPGNPDQLSTARVQDGSLQVGVVNFPSTARFTGGTLANGAAVLGLSDMQDSSLIIAISGTFVGTLKLETCNDANTYHAIACEKATDHTLTLTITTPGVYRVPWQGRYTRISWVDYTSGSANVNCLARAK